MEKLFAIQWLKHLQFQDERLLSHVNRHLERQINKRAFTIRENWLGIHFQKEIQEPSVPPILVRWIDDRMGYGVFATEDLPINFYIGEYTGMVRKRKRRQDRENSYCFEYRIGNWDSNPYVIDARDQGNFTRFINHSDSPNLEPINVHLGGVAHIVLVTVRAIKKGTQLCYHYGEYFWEERKAPQLIDLQ